MAKDKNNLLGNVLSGALKQQGDTEDSIKKKIKILEELKIFIPPLSENEYELLRYNIQNEGCRDALILWKNDNDYILVDGHNRFKICNELNIDYRIEIKKFESIFEVKDWMVSNQLGKRNVTEDAKSYLRGKQYQIEKNRASFKGNQHTKQNNNLETKKTSEKIAEEHKVSAKTIQRDEKYALALDYLVGNDMTLKWKILNREIVIPKTNVLEATEQPEIELQKIRTNLYKEQKNDDFLEKLDNSNKQESSKEERLKIIKTNVIAPTKIENMQSELQKTLKLLMKKPDKQLFETFKKLVDKYENEIFS